MRQARNFSKGLRIRNQCEPVRDAIWSCPNSKFKISYIAERDPTNQKQKSKHATVESSWQMRYRIPHATITKAARLEAAGRPYVWYSHKLYESKHGQKVIVEYCDTLEASEATARKFVGEQVLGFDMEWKPFDATTIKDNIALIQIASEERIALFHIARHAGESPDELVAPTLKLILESKAIQKTGVAIRQADGARLTKYLGLQPDGLVELSDLHNAVVNPNGLTKKLISMAKLTKKYLRLPLKKGGVRTSNWTLRLSQAQIDYAATDAYVGLQLFHTLQHRLQTLPPLAPPALEPTLQTKKLLIRRIQPTKMPLFTSLLAETERISTTMGVSTDKVAGEQMLQAIARAKPKTLRRLRNIANEWNPGGPDASAQFLRVIRENFVSWESQELYLRLHNLGMDSIEERVRSRPLLSAAENRLGPREARRLSVFQPRTEDQLSHLTIGHAQKAAILREIRSYQAKFVKPSPVVSWSLLASTEAAEDLAAAYEKNLLAFRQQLARTVSMRPDEVASLITIMDLARKQPTTVEELEGIDGIQSLLKAAALRAWTTSDLLELLKRLNGTKEDTTVGDDWSFLKHESETPLSNEGTENVAASRKVSEKAQKSKVSIKATKPRIRRVLVSEDDEEFFSTMRAPGDDPEADSDSPPKQLSQESQSSESEYYSSNEGHERSSGSVLAHTMQNLSSLYSYNPEEPQEKKKEEIVARSPKVRKKKTSNSNLSNRSTSQGQ